MEYKNISSPDYIDSLPFQYIETYSFQRGDAFLAQKEKDCRELERLQRRGMRHKLNQDETEILAGLTSQPGTRFLIDEQGKFHNSSVKTHSLLRNTTEVERLISILKTPVFLSPMWMCGPFYRDAIVFYDANGLILSALNICFSCERMVVNNTLWIDGDMKAYPLLRQFFFELGHQLEDR